MVMVLVWNSGILSGSGYADALRWIEPSGSEAGRSFDNRKPGVPDRSYVVEICCLFKTEGILGLARIELGVRLIDHSPGMSKCLQDIWLA